MRLHQEQIALQIQRLQVRAALREMRESDPRLAKDPTYPVGVDSDRFASGNSIRGAPRARPGSREIPLWSRVRIDTFLFLAVCLSSCLYLCSPTFTSLPFLPFCLSFFLSPSFLGQICIGQWRSYLLYRNSARISDGIFGEVDTRLAGS